jgi:flagellar biosynthetic protein FliP
MSKRRIRKPTAAVWVIFASAVLALGAGQADERGRVEPAGTSSIVRPNQPLPEAALPAHDGAAADAETAKGRVDPMTLPPDVVKSAQTVILFGLLSLAPAALLMVTAFVRINIVLVLLRQAMGSPQVPGNQVLTALALLLTALVMRPVAETVYTKAIDPYRKGEVTAVEAWKAGSTPIKTFMVRQIQLRNNQQYLWTLYDMTVRRESPDSPEPRYVDECPLRVVAPAYLLSEIKTGLLIGFFIYLPFLVVDLVVSAVLAAMGLFMLPPSLVALPLKLILFVLAEGWLSVATMLLESFGTPG